MTLVLIDRTAGTNIGDMTAAGGLAAAFDAVTNQAYAACALAASVATDGFVGKTLTGPKIFGQAIVFGSNNFGYSGASNAQVTLNIRGKQTAPSNFTDGTIVGTIGPFSEGANESTGRTITSTDLVTAWNYLFVQVHLNETQQPDCAELQLWEWKTGAATLFAQSVM
jgi:hypothetical protein